MSYITSITKEILQVTYEDISEDEIFDRVSEIIARDIIGSQMDRKYTIDAQEYLAGIEVNKYKPFIGIDPSISNVKMLEEINKTVANIEKGDFEIIELTEED
jgi:hypothetical protein